MSEALGFPQLNRTQAFPVLALLVFPAVSGADSPAIPLTRRALYLLLGFLVFFEFFLSLLSCSFLLFRDCDYILHPLPLAPPNDPAVLASRQCPVPPSVHLHLVAH